MPNSKLSSRAATVLVVDDEELVGELLQDMLRLMGYAPTYCASPHDALEMIESESFDLVLSDYRMPQMSGQEFYDEVRARNPSVAGRMIFLTGDAAADDTQFFLRSTGNTHLAKPFHFNKIKQTLDEAIERQAQGLAA
jgi:two-component system, NtrC family, sensor kinase